MLVRIEKSEMLQVTHHDQLDNSMYPMQDVIGCIGLIG